MVGSSSIRISWGRSSANRHAPSLGVVAPQSAFPPAVGASGYGYSAAYVDPTVPYNASPYTAISGDPYGASPFRSCFPARLVACLFNRRDFSFLSTVTAARISLIRDYSCIVRNQ